VRRPAALLLVLLLAGCGSGTGTADSNYVSGDGRITLVPGDEREQPVTLAGTTLEGARLDLAGHRGKTVVLNVWGAWCPPCRKEARELQAAYLELRPMGVEFVGIDVRDPDPAPALAFQRTFGITYPSLVSKDAQLLLPLRGAVPPNAIPTTLVIDSQGRVAARISSATTKATLVGLVEDVLAGKSAR
jgi:thiol-disulfide isomerase/thioredoxin